MAETCEKLENERDERESGHDAGPDSMDESTETCPKCGSESDWGASSWCPDCGYYPGVNEGIEQSPSSVDAAEDEEGEQPSAPAPLIPMWAQYTLASFASILVGSSIASTYFHYYGGDRGLWSFSQLVIGIILFVSAQFWATVYAMKESNDVALTDMFVTPLDIWRHTFEVLPSGSNRIVMAVSGITMAIGAVVIIGGIDYESFFDTPIVAEREKKPDIVKRAMNAAMETRGSDESGDSFEDSLTDFTDQVIDTSEIDMTMPSEDRPLECFIYGYMQEGRREFGRLLLGAMVMGKTVHVGEIMAKDLTPQVRQTLAVILPSMDADEPAVESAFRGNWVKPTYHLNIEFEGWTVGGTLINPKLATEDEEESKR